MGCGAVFVLNTQSAPLLATCDILYNGFLEEPFEKSLNVSVLLLGSELKRAESSFCATQLHFI